MYLYRVHVCGYTEHAFTVIYINAIKIYMRKRRLKDVWFTLFPVREHAAQRLTLPLC